MARNCTGPCPSAGAVVKLYSGLNPVAYTGHHMINIRATCMPPTIQHYMLLLAAKVAVALGPVAEWGSKWVQMGWQGGAQRGRKCGT